MPDDTKKLSSAKGESRSAGSGGGGGRLELAAIGMEAEFQVHVDGELVRPEDVFGSPRAFVRGNLMHRVGTSYHLPTGGAVYFDTGVIEVATPVIEIDRGCAARAGRSLWESVLYLREELDEWERREGRDVRLTGFSAHYNVSFELPREEQGRSRTVRKLALLLSYILPVPVMLLATNRQSSGVGVRPRGDRIEVTVDFTPSASLMIATGTLIVGIVREVMKWQSFELEMLAEHNIPVIAGYKPMPHTSRKGWLARKDCYSQDPFAQDIDSPVWDTTDGRTMSLRHIAGLITKTFWHPIRRISDPWTFRLIGSVMRGRAPSLLDLDDRPAEYDDVGRLCTWDNLFPETELSRSRYERVLIRAISGQKLWMHGRRYTPTGMRGWSSVVFRADDDGSRHVFGIDYLLGHLRDWERPRTRGG
ncbi:hypothetical protein [Longimicrobium sp.]|jgi:hypothetical protein|uniref:hypothetical protein n=1 Tax=Longimicrobium sp. TaxID=2029185 RepID=UPI002EDAA188